MSNDKYWNTIVLLLGTSQEYEKEFGKQSDTQFFLYSVKLDSFYKNLKKHKNVKEGIDKLIKFTCGFTLFKYNLHHKAFPLFVHILCQLKAKYSDVFPFITEFYQEILEGKLGCSQNKDLVVECVLTQYQKLFDKILKMRETIHFSLEMIQPIAKIFAIHKRISEKLKKDLINPSAVINLLKREIPETIGINYICSDQTRNYEKPIGRNRTMDFETLFHHQDIESIKAVTKNLPHLKPPKNVISILGKISLKSERACECLIWVFDHYKEDIDIKFASADKNRYGEKIIKFLLINGADMFSLNSLNSVAWGNVLNDFYFPCFHTWRPSTHKYLPNELKKAILCFACINAFFKKAKQPFLNKEVLHIVIQLVVYEKIIKYHIFDQLAIFPKKDLLKFCDNPKKEQTGDQLKEMLCQSLSNVLWWKMPFLTRQQRRKIGKIDVNKIDDDERQNLIINRYSALDIPGTRDLLFSIQGEQGFLDLILQCMLTGDVVGVNAIMKVVQVYTCPVWLPSLDEECALLVIEKYGMKASVLVSVLNHNPGLAKKLVIEQKYNLFISLSCSKTKYFQDHAISFIKSYFSYPSPFWKSLEEFYKARCDAQVFIYGSSHVKDLLCLNHFWTIGTQEENYIRLSTFYYKELVKKGALECKEKHMMFQKPKSLMTSFPTQIQQLLLTLL